MQLRTAHLCLDCEEIHAAQQCPVCASEMYAAITRWVPAPERRTRPDRTASPEADAYQTFTSNERPASSGRRLLKRGIVGLTAVGVLGWFLRSSSSSSPARPAAKK